MGRYDNDENYTSNGAPRQRDLVLSTNEFCFIQSKTNGQIKTYTGPIMVTISQQESMVVFNNKTKRFEETGDFEKARQIFTSAPEGWYVVLKNPAKDFTHPDIAKAVNSPELNIGCKINIPGPASFSLYPGQMTKVVRGHRLRSNQYLLARVYDADAAAANIKTATMVDAEGKEVKVKEEKYFVGQILVIKGTEISFYIPPTGIEVIPTDKGEYVRDAVTLERLEYSILKDENGSKRYVPGPVVVFPKPTETFVKSENGTHVFRALELSPISGIYVKVIAEYKDEDGTVHPVGEELFITGKDQMIYYPRPEHALIQYDGKYMHHAIAIPEGEGRYILNRLDGKIKTVKGPAMYLPDPRTEVVVKRKLTAKECQLLYPDNSEVLAYNNSITEKQQEKLARKGLTNTLDALDMVYSTSNNEDALAIFEATANISRGVSYTKPRTITLDTKYDGVVSVDVWTGYAMNVVSKTGKREVVVGPTTRLLDYDETVEAMYLSTGRPKTTDNLLTTGFLRVENNKVSDLINVQTKDYVDVQIKVSYCVDFLNEYKDKWFSVENYVKYLCDRMRSLVKREVKRYTIQEFYANSTDITRNIILNIDTNAEQVDREPKPVGRLFKENGMFVKDVEILSVGVERVVAEMLEKHQTEMVEKALELANAEGKMEIVKKLEAMEKEELKLKNDNKLYSIELAKKEFLAKSNAEETERAARRAATKAENQAKKDLQPILDEIKKAELAREKAESDENLRFATEQAKIEKAKQDAYAASVVKIMEAVQPGLIEAINANTQGELVNGIGSAISPYAMANGESVADTISTLLRGSKLEEALKNFMPPKN